tara:strand:- start:2925 stop:3296 length:372 start_codon:yes stop_codon:yes gene_type:complete
MEEESIRLSIEDAPEENMDYDEICSKCDGLINSETINKEEALKILKLFHSAEKKYLEMLFIKQKEIHDLKNELTIVKLTNKNTEMIQQLSQDLLRTDKLVQEIVPDLANLNSQVLQLINNKKR